MITMSLKQIYVNLLLSEWKAVVCKQCTLYEKKKYYLCSSAAASYWAPPPRCRLRVLQPELGENLQVNLARKCFQKQGKAHMSTLRQLKLATLRSFLGAVVMNLCLFCFFAVWSVQIKKKSI